MLVGEGRVLVVPDRAQQELGRQLAGLRPSGVAPMGVWAGGTVSP